MATRGRADGSRLLGWDAVRARDRARRARTQARAVYRYGCLQDDPNFYRRLHRRCLCPDRRRPHAPLALCPALPRWMTLTLPRS